LPTVVPVGVVGRLNALTPLRLFDTRDAAGAAGLIALARDGTGRVAASSPFSLQLTGAFGVPGDATAVAMNLSAVDATAGGFARAWPALVTEPTASTVNFPAASVVTNSALVGVGSNGQLSFSANVPTHLVADLQGFFATAGAGFVPEKGKRLLDTRADAGGMLKAHVSRVIVPASAAAAVALNVSATGSANAGFVTVFPCDQPVPVASSVNFAAGQTLGASVIARMGPAGVCAVAMVDVHVIVDQVGVFEAVGGLAFQPVQPVRLVDTRAPTSPWVGRTTRQTPLELDVARLAGLPARSQALALNVTVTDAVDDGFVTVFPCASGLPGTSNVNYRAGQTVANLALVGVGDGKVCVTSTGRTHVILDLTGVFVAPPPPTPDGGSMPVDAGSPPTDAGEAPPPDAGADAPASPHGCGCRGGDVPLAAFALLLIALGRRSR
jgi:hypothetical protein